MAPAATGLLARLRGLYTGAEPEAPVLATSTAIALLVLYTIIYVAPFYLSRLTRPSAAVSRDSPSVIRARIRSVTLSTALCSIATFLILLYVPKNGNAFKALHSMGYYPIGLAETGKALLLTAILFMGPLYEAGIVEGRLKNWVRLRGFSEAVGGWAGWRNIVAGPITEELLFRSASVPLLLLSPATPHTTLYLTPLIFGLAHVHHFYEFRLSHPSIPLLTLCLRTLLQLSYTTLFGSYATFLYIRTGSLGAVIVAHMFCNWMGFPRFYGRLEGVEEEIVDGRKVGERYTEVGVVWSVVYYGLLVVGAVGWWKMLWPLTESELALSVF